MTTASFGSNSTRWMWHWLKISCGSWHCLLLHCSAWPSLLVSGAGCQHAQQQQQHGLHLQQATCNLCEADRLGDFFTATALSAGPLVVGLTLSAIAVGATFSAGALAFTTFILPMVVLMGVGGLASFGLFAGLGAVFVLPQLLFSAMSLVSGCANLGGWAGVAKDAVVCQRYVVGWGHALHEQPGHACRAPELPHPPVRVLCRCVAALCRRWLVEGWRWAGAASTGCCSSSHRIRVSHH